VILNYGQTYSYDVNDFLYLVLNYALNMLRHSNIGYLNSWQLPMIYIFFEGLSCCCWLLILVLISAKERTKFKNILKQDHHCPKKRLTLAGLT